MPIYQLTVLSHKSRCNVAAFSTCKAEISVLANNILIWKLEWGRIHFQGF